MYGTILLALDTTPTDRVIVEHVKQLAAVMHSRVVLLHVATGASAQYHGSDAAGLEIEEDSAYLAQVQQEFATVGVAAETELAFGDPAREIVRWVREKGCDLVAMGTHGHKMLADMVLGTTANKVQHNISVPVLLLRAK